MKTSNEGQKRHLSDIHKFRSADPRIRWLPSAHEVNLRPTFYKRRPFAVLGMILFLAVSTFALRSIFTRAEMADFFPATCLGTWQNPHLAQGVPEGLQDGTLPNELTSAVFRGTEGVQIFCGGFVGSDFKGEGSLTSVALTFVWNMEGIAASSSLPAAAPETTVSPGARDLKVAVPSEETSSPVESPKIKNPPSFRWKSCLWQ